MCHEAERLAGRLVACHWCGCRAPQLAAKCTEVEGELRSARDNASAGAASGEMSLDVQQVYTTMLSLFGLKFHWVYQLPFTVWTLDGKEAARKFIAAHDAQVDAGEPVHRVSAFLAGKEEPWSMRDDLENLARTGHWTDRLFTEVQAYKLCPLDETWIESVHRDLSRISTRVPSTSVPFLAATLRLQQNFSDLDKRGHYYAERLEHWWSRISAIGRVFPPPQCCREAQEVPHLRRHSEVCLSQW